MGRTGSTAFMIRLENAENVEPSPDVLHGLAIDELDSDGDEELVEYLASCRSRSAR